MGRGLRDGSRPYKYRKYSSPRRESFRDRRAPSFKPELWASVEKGDEVLVRELLDQPNADVEQKFCGWSPLLKAAEEGHEGILMLLLEKQAEIDVQNRKGRTALSFAAASSMKRPTPLNTLKLLLEHGADMDAKDDNGLTAKAHAQRENRVEALKILNEWENPK